MNNLMSTARQDAWSIDDDLILAEVSLRNIREGRSQISAFDEVGERIGRTSFGVGLYLKLKGDKY